MISALMEKEFRQHGWMILLFWMLIAIGLFLLKSNQSLGSIGGSGFYLMTWLLLVLFPLACLVLGNALIATEFRQKTQIFLDGLPLPRWKMVAVKYGVGLVVALITSVMPLALTLALSWNEEALDSSFVMLLTTKTLLWAWFCWSVIFPFSLLGRYRMVVGLFVVIGLLAAQNLGNVPVNRFGPFELVGERFAYERAEFPVQAMWITIGLITLLTCAGFAMALVRDATLAAMLSEKMSSREKLAMIALGLSGMMVLASLIDRVEKTEPLDLPDSIDIVDARVSISMAAAVAVPTREERAAMRQHAEGTAKLLRAVADFLGIQKMPPIYMVHRRDMDYAEFEDGELDSRQGYLVRLNVLTTPQTDPAYESHMIERILDVNQHNRLASDTRGWILEGFAYWWPRRQVDGDAAATESQLAKDIPTIEASQPLPHVTARDLLRWKRFRQSLPEGGAGWFAAQNIQTLWNQNENGCRAFLSATLGYTAPHDVRATLHDWWNNVPYLVNQLLRMDLEQVATNWNVAVSSSLSRHESSTQ